MNPVKISLVHTGFPLSHKITKFIVVLYIRRVAVVIECPVENTVLVRMDNISAVRAKNETVQLEPVVFLPL